MFDFIIILFVQVIIFAIVVTDINYIVLSLQELKIAQLSSCQSEGEDLEEYVRHLERVYRWVKPSLLYRYMLGTSYVPTLPTLLHVVFFDKS